MISERDMALRYEIDDRGDDLLQRAEAAAKSVQNVELKADQVRGLLRQAQAGYGAGHLCNWLRYQQARVPEWRTSGLAEAVLQDIEALREEARAIARTLYHGQARRQEGIVWLALARRYIAYLERWYRVEREGNHGG